MTSRVIFDGALYSACAMSDGSLIVQSKRSGKGIRIEASHPQCAQWIYALDASGVSASEMNYMCRGFLSA